MQAEEDEAKDKKRRKLEEIEDELMGTQNAKRTAELYQEYMEEHKRTKRASDRRFDKQNDFDSPEALNRKQNACSEMQEESTGSRDPASYAEPEVMHIDQVMMEEWSGQEKKWDDDVNDYVKKIRHVSDDEEEYARDDVNNFELPMKLVREARKEEMKHMMKKIFKGRQEIGGPPCDGEGTHQHEVGGHG